MATSNTSCTRIIDLESNAIFVHIEKLMLKKVSKKISQTNSFFGKLLSLFKDDKLSTFQKNQKNNYNYLDTIK